MSFELDHGTYGTRMILQSEWSEAAAKAAPREGVRELELNYAKGWTGKTLRFVELLSELQALEVTDWTISDVSPIHALHELRRLKVSTYCETEIDFAQFPHLEDVSIEWRAKARSLFGCWSLRKVFINRYRGKDLGEFCKLPQLQHLALANPTIEILQNSSMPSLRFLGLHNAKRLKSLDGIDLQTALTQLEINGCRLITDLDPLRHLRELRHLELCDDGRIASLKPIAGLSQLAELHFYGTTSIQDGDLSPLLRLNLTRVSFADRPHYNIKLADLL